jgi:hypothetical protein
MDRNYAGAGAVATAQNGGPHASAGMDHGEYVSNIDISIFAWGCFHFFV